MKQNNSNLLYHLVAFVTVAIWGTTFVSTKVLMLNGLSPAQIFTLRFSIAYMMMLMVNHKRMFADSWKDEFNLKSATYRVSWEFTCKTTKILLLYIFLGHNRNVVNTKFPYPIKRLEVIRRFNQKSMAFNQSLS